MPFHYPGYMEVERDENARLWEAAWQVEPGGLSRKRGLTTTEILSHRTRAAYARSTSWARTPS